LNYDDVMNQQREIIYKERQKVLAGDDIRENIMSMVESVVDNIISSVCGGMQFADEWAWENYEPMMLQTFGIVPEFGDEKFEFDNIDFKNIIMEKVTEFYSQREEEFGVDENGDKRMRELERIALLKAVDNKWMEHIDAMDQLKNGIGLRAYGQHDPVVEYKIEGMDMFDEMINNIKTDTVKMLYHAKTNAEMKREQVAEPMKTSGDGSLKKTPTKNDDKVGRNDLCPCGSGLKYKKCCGK
ncbi:MAG: SEC-C domain-containing protein, partial [Clostridia bacterium]|nr:SEC-C domain-containing protein [Clostridia bacterium]